MTVNGRRMARAALYLGAWTLLALLSASQSILTYRATGGPVYVGPVLTLTLLLWYTWAALAPAVLRLGTRFPLTGTFWLRNVGLHVATNALFALVAVAIYRAARGLAGMPPPRSFPVELLGNLHTHVLTYWILIGIAHAAMYWRRARDREVRAAELAAELSEARLDALRMQLHPHFLFNTMHAIAAAVRQDPGGAEDMLAELADLLRATLDRPAGHEVSLREELAFIERYIAIQKVRFGERLEVRIDVAEDALDMRVPTLILQPIVENAIEHGIAARRQGGRLELTARTDSAGLRLDVSDDGPGLLDRELHPDGWRVGLRNTRARLVHLYGEGASVELRNRDGGGLLATLRIPGGARV